MDTQKAKLRDQISQSFCTSLLISFNRQHSSFILRGSHKFFFNQIKAALKSFLSHWLPACIKRKERKKKITKTALYY